MSIVNSGSFKIFEYRVDSDPVLNQEYYIDSGVKEIQVQDIVLYPVIADPNWNYQAMTTGGTPLPSGVTFDSTLKKFIVNSADASLAGITHSISYTATAQIGELTGDQINR